jgi:hypothetical protein
MTGSVLSFELAELDEAARCTPSDMALAKALSLQNKGELARAGKVFKQYLVTEARGLKMQRQAELGRQTGPLR